MTQATRREEAQVRALPQYLICHHIPRCPAATAPDHDAARTVTTHPEQGWSLLCNGVVLFDDYGELLPDGRAVSPGQDLRFAAPQQQRSRSTAGVLTGDDHGRMVPSGVLELDVACH